MRPASARRVQQNTRTQLLVKILQERKKAGGAIQGGCGLADGIEEREYERPLPGRLAAPGTGLDHSVIAFGEAAGQGRRGRSPTLSAAAKNVWEREYSKSGGSNYVNNNSSSG